MGNMMVVIFVINWLLCYIKTDDMKGLKRITLDPKVMGGKPCIRGLRMTVGTVIGLLASGLSSEEIIKMYPYLEFDDIIEALSYASWRAEEIEVPLAIA